MNNVRSILRITRYQFLQLVRNPRLYMIMICNFIFLSTLIVPLRRFMKLYYVKATPFLFGFLFSHASVVFCFFVGIVLLFSNAPFFNHSQMFLVIRTKKLVWALGQMLYLLAGSVLYFLLLYGMSLLFLIPHISVRNEWGEVWNTLVRTDLGLQCGVTLAISADILNRFDPMELQCWIFLIGVLNALLIGLILFFCNLYFHREVGITVAILLILAPYRLSFMPDFLHYIVTVAWLDPTYLFYSPTYKGPDGMQQLLILCGMILFFIFCCIYGIYHRDLPEVEE